MSQRIPYKLNFNNNEENLTFISPEEVNDNTKRSVTVIISAIRSDKCLELFLFDLKENSTRLAILQNEKRSYAELATELKAGQVVTISFFRVRLKTYAEMNFATTNEYAIDALEETEFTVHRSSTEQWKSIFFPSSVYNEYQVMLHYGRDIILKFQEIEELINRVKNGPKRNALFTTADNKTVAIGSWNLSDNFETLIRGETYWIGKTMLSKYHVTQSGNENSRIILVPKKSTNAEFSLIHKNTTVYEIATLAELHMGFQFSDNIELKNASVSEGRRGDDRFHFDISDGSLSGGSLLILSGRSIQQISNQQQLNLVGKLITENGELYMDVINYNEGIVESSHQEQCSKHIIKIKPESVDLK